jgi:hypothetical protein
MRLRGLPFTTQFCRAISDTHSRKWHVSVRKYLPDMQKRRTRASSASVIWYVVVRPKRLLIVCGEQSPPHSGEVSNATPYLHSKELGEQ